MSRDKIVAQFRQNPSRVFVEGLKNRGIYNIVWAGVFTAVYEFVNAKLKKDNLIRNSEMKS